MQTIIRKWGNSASAIIPAAALSKAGMNLGDTIEIDAEKGVIRFKQAEPEYSLDQLLDASPEKSLQVDDEDREWLQDSPVGEEFGE